MIGVQKVAWGLFFVLLAGPSYGKWQRIVTSGKGEWKDVPVPHSLSYFTANPFLRDDAGDFCIVCNTAQGRADSARKYIAESNVLPVGTLAGFKIFDVLYRVGPRKDGKPTVVNWKSILIQTGHDQYREIFHAQEYYCNCPLSPSEIVQVGNEQMLVTKDSDGGNGGGYIEAYWSFDRSGPHEINFSPILAAIIKYAAKRFGPAKNFQIGYWGTYPKQNEVKAWLQKAPAQCRACGALGTAVVGFRLVGAVAEPASFSFEPDQK